MPLSLKKAVLRTARHFGYSVVTEWQRETFLLAEYLTKLFALLQVDCVLDVGANEGQYHDFLRGRCGFKGLIVSFEPTPDAVRVLGRRASADPLWVIEPVALGAAAGEGQFHLMAGSEFSSFLKPTSTEDGRFETQNQIVQSLTVEVRTVDAVLPDLRRRFGFRAPFLKLDTQGYDLEVVKGATSSLSEIRALQSEIYLRRIYEQAPAYDESIRWLQALGFAVGFITPNNATSHFPILCDLDCVMVNTGAMPP
jgi:FkbM family methyltransferase